MHIAMFYIEMLFFTVILFAIAFLLSIGFLIFMLTRRKAGSLITGITTCFLITAGVVSALWLASHSTYPDINDWAYLGRNVKSIETRYGDAVDISFEDDGSGVATIPTGDIVGHSVHDSGDYAYYCMAFDTQGKITAVWCKRGF